MQRFWSIVRSIPTRVWFALSAFFAIVAPIIVQRLADAYFPPGSEITTAYWLLTGLRDMFSVIPVQVLLGFAAGALAPWLWDEGRRAWRRWRNLAAAEEPIKRRRLAEIAPVKATSAQASAETKGQAPQVAHYGRLHAWQIQLLIERLTELKTELPDKIIVARPQMGEPQIFSRRFEHALLRGGFAYDVRQQNPSSPQETGVLVAVPDVEAPSALALKIQGIIQQLGFEGRFMRLDSPGDFAIFVGPSPL